jgi:hypothetical protein
MSRPKDGNPDFLDRPWHEEDDKMSTGSGNNGNGKPNGPRRRIVKTVVALFIVGLVAVCGMATYLTDGGHWLAATLLVLAYWMATCGINYTE